MRHILSFAVTLHRIFDSRPPESTPVFTAEGKALQAHRKPGGLYVFPATDVERLEVGCRGYLPATVRPASGKVLPVPLYPDQWCVPPPGWKLLEGSSRPAVNISLPDGNAELRLLEYDASCRTARIRTRQGVTGGCLQFGGAEQRSQALILEKRPPDCYLLEGLGERFVPEGAVSRVYVTRADREGRWFMAVPGDFEERGHSLWEWVW